MTTFREIPLGELAQIRTGKLDSNAAVSGGAYPFFTCAPVPLKIDQFAFDCEAVLLAGNNANAKFHVNYYRGKFNAYQRTYVIESRCSDVTTRYLYYAITRLASEFGRHSNGSVTKFLTRQILDPWLVPVPPREVQCRIVEILGSIDDKIAINERCGLKLEEMAQALFKSWFVDFDPVVAKSEGRKPFGMSDEIASLFPDSFEESELGPIPHGWTVSSVGELLTDVIGGDWGKEVPDGDHDTEVAIIRGTDFPDLHRGRPLRVPRRYTQKRKMERRLLQEGDLLIEISGGSRDQPTGRTLLVLADILSTLGPAVPASFCRRLRPKDHAVGLVLFLHCQHLYNSDEILKYEVPSTGISNFQFEYFAREEKVIVAPSDLLRCFYDIVAPMFSKLSSNRAEIRTLSRMRDVLLPELLLGEPSPGASISRQLVEEVTA